MSDLHVIEPRPGDRLVWRYGGGRTAEIVDVVVGSERRRGRGRAMVEALVRGLRPAKTPPAAVSVVYAVTRWSNAIAQQFYEALGFRLAGRLHNFYRDGAAGEEHAAVYCLDL